jgi:VanZ family protein
VAGTRRRLAALLPVAAWLGVIALGSSDLGSNQHVTQWVIAHLARWFPGLAAHAAARHRVADALWGLRKPAHLFEYAILALLAYRAATMLTGWGRRRRVAASIAFCALVGGLDELHQSLDPARTALATDALVDVLGGVGGLLIGAVVRRWQDRR